MASQHGPGSADSPERSRPTLIAHRGFAGVHPENTLAAIERAAATGPDGQPASAEMIEIDVMPAATGEVVVFHDTRPGRLTDAPPAIADRIVWDLPYETLADLEVLDSGERVPLLADALAAIPPELAVNVELKNPGSGDVRVGQRLDDASFARHESRWRAFAADVAAVLAGFPHEVLVSSFHEPALAAVRVVEPDLPVAFVCQDSIERSLAVARRYDCEAVHPPMEMIAGTALFDADAYDPAVDLVECAKAENRAVNAWTVEHRQEADQLRQAGVDGLIADYPGLLTDDAR